MPSRRIKKDDNPTSLQRTTAPLGSFIDVPTWEKLKKLSAVGSYLYASVNAAMSNPAYAASVLPDNPGQAFRDVAQIFKTKPTRPAPTSQTPRPTQPGTQTPRPFFALRAGIDFHTGVNLDYQRSEKGPGAATQPFSPAQFAKSTPQPGAPFGTNAAGERLDASGRVWDPATAGRDIYGGQFIQAGETRWERNEAGRLVKVKYLGGGQKRILGKGKILNPKGKRK
jgi:hypothetical protein